MLTASGGCAMLTASGVPVEERINYSMFNSVRWSSNPGLWRKVSPFLYPYKQRQVMSTETEVSVVHVCVKQQLYTSKIYF